MPATLTSITAGWVERIYHVWFAAARDHGEWFRISVDQVRHAIANFDEIEEHVVNSRTNLYTSGVAYVVR